MTTFDAAADIPQGILRDLNEPQRQAVTHRDGPLLVLAGPGSGKTRVITRRAAHLVYTGVPARSVLAITFTNKAADEMRRRIETLGVARGMWVYTFHALGARLLREFGPLGRVGPNFTIYDESDQLRVIKDAMEQCGVGDHLLRPEEVQNEISNAKNRLLTPPAYAERQANDSWAGSERRMVARIYDVYEQLMQRRNAVDFDDLLMRVALVLRDYPDVTEQLNHRFRYVLIDEYQDTNHAQYLIAKLLSQHRNVCATGDPDQSIYGWRGADLGNILDFERDYPDATVVRLEQNYRSTANILRVASSLITANRRRKRKELWTENAAGELVRIWHFAEGRDEAERIGDTIAAMHKSGRPWSDFALAYRVNSISRGLEESLRARGIPYKIARGLEFYNRREIKDTLAYLHALVNPADEVALLRAINTPARGIGKTTIGRLVQAADLKGLPLVEVIRRPGELADLPDGSAAKVEGFARVLDQLQRYAVGSVMEAVNAVLKLSGLEKALQEESESEGEDRLANVQELVTAAARYEKETEEPNLGDFLQRISLTSDQDAVDESAGVVLLLTLHAAKGLEFPVVFMVGLEHGTLPHERALKEGGDVEEERRLCFVGVTRAKERLFISHARERLIRGSMTPRSASQFLRELECEAVRAEKFDRFAPPRYRSNEYGRDDGFVPMDDQLPPEEARRRFGRSSQGGATRWRDAVEFDSEDAPMLPRRRHDAPPPLDRAASPFADWQPGTFVQHAKFGVGQIVRLDPVPGQTRAAIRFARFGEKTFILEQAPITKLERRQT